MVNATPPSGGSWELNFTGVLTRPWHSLLMVAHPFQLPISATTFRVFAKLAKQVRNLTVSEATGQ
jgi:hypothetical protein